MNNRGPVPAWPSTGSAGPSVVVEFLLALAKCPPLGFLESLQEQRPKQRTLTPIINTWPTSSRSHSYAPLSQAPDSTCPCQLP